MMDQITVPHDQIVYSARNIISAVWLSSDRCCVMIFVLTAILMSWLSLSADHTPGLINPGGDGDRSFHRILGRQADMRTPLNSAAIFARK